MSTFDEREKGFEAKFVLDQERLFKIQARRNKLLGLWVAEQLNLEGGTAESYAQEVIKADFEEEGDEDVIRKIMADYKQYGLTLDTQHLRERLKFFQDQARQEILGQDKA